MDEAAALTLVVGAVAMSGGVLSATLMRMREEPVGTVGTDSWLLGIDAWVIQDGNYPDFVIGQQADFAVEFADRRGLTVVDDASGPRVKWVEASRYEVTAQIVHDETNARVLDFGLRAYRFIGIEDPEHRSQVGAWVTGEINLAVDPFFYKDELANEAGFPTLIYSWTVQGLLLRTGHGPVPIERTNAWVDLSAPPSYLLRCVSAGPGPVGPPRRPGPGPMPR